MAQLASLRSSPGRKPRTSSGAGILTCARAALLKVIWRKFSESVASKIASKVRNARRLCICAGLQLLRVGEGQFNHRGHRGTQSQQDNFLWATPFYSRIPVRL